MNEIILIIYEYFRSEKFLKLIIRKKKCKKFVVCMLELFNYDYDYIMEKIWDFISNGIKKFIEGNVINVILFLFVLFLNDWFFYNVRMDVLGLKDKIFIFLVLDELLRKYFYLLYIVFEFCVIVDEMF